MASLGGSPITKAAFAIVAAAVILNLSGCSVNITTPSASGMSVTTHGGTAYYASGRSIFPSAAKFTATEVQNAAAGLAPSVAILNDYGDVVIKAGTVGSPVTVSAVKHAAAKADLAKLSLVVDHCGNAVTIQVKLPKSRIN